MLLEVYPAHLCASVSPTVKRGPLPLSPSKSTLRSVDEKAHIRARHYFIIMNSKKGQVHGGFSVMPILMDSHQYTVRKQLLSLLHSCSMVVLAPGQSTGLRCNFKEEKVTKLQLLLL